MKMQDYTVIWERWADGRNRYTICETREVLETHNSYSLNEVILPMLHAGGATCGTVTIKVQPEQEIAVEREVAAKTKKAAK